MDMCMLGELMRPGSRIWPARRRCPAVAVAVVVQASQAVPVGVGVVILGHLTAALRGSGADAQAGRSALVRHGAPHSRHIPTSDYLMNWGCWRREGAPWPGFAGSGDLIPRRIAPNANHGFSEKFVFLEISVQGQEEQPGAQGPTMRRYPSRSGRETQKRNGCD
jgi:hypothetical protein